jgi:C4-dicarboxylate-specific signal transduction histidine kinase
VQWEYLALRKDGVALTLEKVVRLVNWQGSPAIQCTVIDITERKQAEARARLHQAELMHMARLSTMGELATTLAHELNQPLTAIVTYTEGVARRLRAGEPISTGFREVLEQTAALAKRAAHILRGIRDFVRKHEVARQSVDLNAVIGAAIDLTASEAQHKGIAVAIDLAEGLPHVKGSFIQLEQVVLNLVRNAIEAMESIFGEGHVLTVSTAKDVNEAIELTVQDTGPGLPPELGLRVLEPFVTSKKTGLGMGLTISRTIVEAHGGHLQVSSLPGGGTRAQVLLPTLRAAPLRQPRVKRPRAPTR